MISVLCPSRGRPELLARSLKSLLDTASDPQDVEVLVRIDTDDPTSDRYWLTLLDCGSFRMFAGESFGYTGQHIYTNALAGAARGDWLMNWNDDALMLTEGWDEVVRRHDGRFELLAFAHNHGEDYDPFVCVPHRWFDTCGHLSLDCRLDTWMGQVARGAGCFVREHEVVVLHDRADLTGNNDDKGYRDRYTDPGFETSFWTEEMVAARASDVAHIRGAM